MQRGRTVVATALSRETQSCVVDYAQGVGTGEKKQRMEFRKLLMWTGGSLGGKR